MASEDTANLRRHLAAVLPRLFGSLSDELLAELEPQIEWVRLRRNETLLRQGEDGDSMFLIVSGRVCVVWCDRSGTEHVLAELSRGESIGEMALITGEPRSASIYAMRHTVLMKVRKETFDGIVEKYPQVMRAIAEILIERLRKKREPSRAASAVRTVAIVPAGPDVPLDDVCTRLVSALSRYDSVLHLTADKLDGLVGRPGLAETPEAIAAGAELTNWLDDQETRHRFVVYESDGGVSAWTRRCIHQADQILIVGQAFAEAAPGEIEGKLLETEARITDPRQTLVLLHPDGSRLPRGTRNWLDARQVDDHYHVRLDRDADFERLARVLSGRTIGLALGGGGALCLAEFGVIRALEEAGVPIDMIGGTSMGAGVSCLYAMGHTYESGIRVNRAGWVDKQPFRDYAIPFVSLFRSRRFDGIAKMACGDGDIEDLWVPYFCVSSNLTTADMVVHRRGPLWQAVRASCTIPGLAAPVPDSGHLLVDGGVVNNLPGDVLREQGCGTVIVVDVSPTLTLNVDRETIPNCWEILWSRILPFRKRLDAPSIRSLLMAATMLSSQSRKMAVKEDADVVFEPPLSQYSLLEFHKVEEIAETGYEHAKARLHELATDETFQQILFDAGVSRDV